MKRSVVGLIANICEDRKRCIETNNREWVHNHEMKLTEIESQNLPHGSGIDNGCSINHEKSNKDKVVIDFDFHVMDENGFYDGWVNFKAVAKPVFDGIEVRIIGKDTHFLKDYLQNLFCHVLTNEIEY